MKARSDIGTEQGREREPAPEPEPLHCIASSSSHLGQTSAPLASPGSRRQGLHGLHGLHGMHGMHCAGLQAVCLQIAIAWEHGRENGDSCRGFTVSSARVCSPCYQDTDKIIHQKMLFDDSAAMHPLRCRTDHLAMAPGSEVT